MTISMLGREYEISIPPDVWAEFKAAPSLGSYFERYIKGQY